jgi:hypothetical protein
MFRGPIALRTQCSLNESAIPVARRVILPINAPTHALVPRQLHLHVEPTLFLLLPSKTMLVRVNHVAVEEAQEAPSVVIGIFSVNEASAVALFDSEASYSSYLLHMLGSIICP